MQMSTRSSVEMVVTQHAREGCGRRCATLFASELLVVCGRHIRVLYLAVTFSVMCRLRTAGSFGRCRMPRCWLDSELTFLRQIMALLVGISHIFCVKMDSGDLIASTGNFIIITLVLMKRR